MDGFVELEIVRLDRIEKRAREYFERAARKNNVQRMMRAAKLEKAAYDRSMTIVSAEVRPFTSLT
jgi:hypothetical protein